MIKIEMKSPNCEVKLETDKTAIPVVLLANLCVGALITLETDLIEQEEEG